MTLDETIIRLEEAYKNKKGDAEEARLQEQDKYADECIECAAEYRQLAEWLKELKGRRDEGGAESMTQDEVLKVIKTVAMDMITNTPSHFDAEAGGEVYEDMDRINVILDFNKRLQAAVKEVLKT